MRQVEKFSIDIQFLRVLEAARKGAAGCFLNEQSSTLARQWAFSV